MHTPRVAIGLAAALALTPLIPSLVHAAPPASAPIVVQRAQLRDDAPFLDWANVWEAHHRIEKWVESGGETLSPGMPIPVKGLVGVRVTLRWAGILLGVGQVTGAELQTGSNGVVDLALCTRDAAKIAIADAQSHLTEAGNRYLIGHIKMRPTNDFALTLKNVGPLMTVDIQAAHSMEIIHIEKNASPQAIYSAFIPMYQGLHLVHIDKTNNINESWVWPGQVQAGNIEPSNQVLMAVTQVGLAIEDVTGVGRPGGIDAARFDVIQVVRPSGEAGGIPAQPANLIRGNVLLPPTSLDTPQIERLSDRLTAHLLRTANSDGSFAGLYMPTRDDYDPIVATEEDSALILYALTRRANFLSSQDPISPGARSIRDTLRPGMIYLAQKFHTQGTAFPPAAAALMLMTLNDGAQFSDQKPLRDELVGFLYSLRNTDGFFRNPTGKATTNGPALVSHPTQSLIIDALAHTYAITRDPILGNAMRKSLAAIWPTIEPERTLGSLAWLTDAQAIMDRYGPAAATDARLAMTQPASTRPADMQIDVPAGLRNVLKLLAMRQITRPPPVGPADVVGGFEFGTHTVDAAPLADWRSALVVQFISLALRDPRLITPDERIQWILCAGSGARFINQLMFEEPGTYYVRSPDHALGGVRLSLIDNRLPPAATAASLLATTQFQESLVFLTTGK